MGVAHNWFATYSAGREQFCFPNSQISSKSNIECGIPQGSCLMSLLFILYVNDFEQCLHESSPTIYAEDTTVTYAASVLLELHQVITTDLSNVSEWMRVNKLSLNVNKGKFIVIGNTKQI